MRRMPVGVVTAAIVCGVLLLGGVILFLSSNPGDAASFGWFAYQPLADATFIPGSLIVLTPLRATAAAISVVGLVGIGAVAGYVLGRGRRNAL